MPLFDAPTVLTLEPLGGYLQGGTMTKNFWGSITYGKTVVDVKYPADMSRYSIDDGVYALARIIKETPGKLLVFAHSQGAQVVSRWLRTRATDADAPTGDRVGFLLIGNPLRKYGGFGVGQPEFDGHKGLPTLNNSRYNIVDCKLQYDGWADIPTDPKPGVMAALNVQQDRYGVNGIRGIHAMGYRYANLNDTERKTYTEGTTEYVMLPHKPLVLAPQWLIEASYTKRPEK